MSGDWAIVIERSTRDISAVGDRAVQVALEDVYQAESRRVFATLVRLLGDFDLAEDALHDAFTAAMQQWPVGGIPASPRAWLVSTGRFKAIDTIRRRARFNRSLAVLAEDLNDSDEFEIVEQEDLQDDRLRLIFTCCHPALAAQARIALTLREVCGLTTEEIARAFLVPPATLAQRIVRAKAKIRDAGIPYQIPTGPDLPERLDAVLHVIYLVFNEGYSASFGDSLTRADLSGEAIRLGSLLVKLLPEPEVKGLLGLMLLQESRRDARTSADGDLILLEDQDRSLWDGNLIAAGTKLVEEALQSGQVGSYALQAAIAAVHAEAPDAASTDWAQIVELYGLLVQAEPSPVVRLNRAVAIGMRDGPAAGLTQIVDILASGDLSEYHLAHAARAEFSRRIGRIGDAEEAYQRALSLTEQEPERRFLQRQIESLRAASRAAS